jgi:hypothetical protein
MKKLNFLLVLMLSLFIASCGNSEKAGDGEGEIKLKVDADLGELGEFLSAEDEAVIKLEEAEEDGEQGYLITSSLGVDVEKAVASDFSFGLEAKILDKSHIVIADFPSFDIESKNDFDNEDYTNVLYTGQKWAIVKEFVKKDDWDKEKQEMWEKIKKEGAYIRIEPNYSGTAKFVAYKGAKNSSSDEISSEENDEDEISDASASDSEDWDALLESYEEYVDKYISYMKKAAKGDMNALSEYPALLEKAQEFSEKMQNAQGVMSSSQWSRYIKITNKMTKAAQEMSN